MIRFIDFLGGRDFIEKKYPIQDRATIHHLRSYLENEYSEDAKLTEECFFRVNEKDPDWIKKQKKRILANSLSESLAALGEMRAYADLLNMGFDVIPNGTKTGADFTLQHSKTNEKAFVEVATKTLPSNNIRPNPNTVSKEQRTAIFEMAYFGFPKDGENFVENAVSKIASTKEDFHQASASIPSLLFIDFQNLPLNSSMIDNSFPCSSFQGAIYSGALWCGLYGEKGTPLYEDARIGTPKADIGCMKHSGMFAKGNSNNYAGVFCSFSSAREGLCFFENPEKTIIPKWIKVHMSCNHRFNLQCSCLKYGDIDLQEYIDLRNHQIADLGKMYSDIDVY